MSDTKETGVPLALDEMSPVEVFYVFQGGLEDEGALSLTKPYGLANQAAHIAEAQYQTALAMGYTQDIAAWHGLRTIITEQHAVVHAQVKAGLHL